MEETIEIAEHYKFFKRVQQPRKTVIEYMSGLKQLASTCNFSEYLDTALRDQLVCGICDQKIQRELLSLKDLTVRLALQKSQAIEVATRETENLQHSSAVEMEIVLLALSHKCLLGTLANVTVVAVDSTKQRLPS